MTLLLLGITAQAAPTVDLDLEAPWAVAEQDALGVTLRLGDTPDGVRVQIAPEGSRLPGITPVHAGRTLWVHEHGEDWPLIGLAWPDRPLDRVEIAVQGPDLVVRLYGPPLDTVSAHPDAPKDPVHTWVRLRPRLDDWRIVLDGLGVVSVPARSVVLEPMGMRVDGAWGALSWTTDAAHTSSAWLTERWGLSTGPALQAIQPYPRTSMTWTPSP